MTSESQPLQCLIRHIKECILTEGTVTCALLAKTALVELLKLPSRMMLVIYFTVKDLLVCDVVDEDAIRVPKFYAPPNEGPKLSGLTVVTIIIAMLFGGIHCAGWNFPFPSHTDRYIWKSCSIVIVIVPCAVVLVLSVSQAVELLTGVTMNDKTLFTVFILWPNIVFYVLARTLLLLEALTCLRHLTPGAYAVVEWTALLLHM